VLFSNEKEAEFYEQIESILPPRWQRLARAEKSKRYGTMAYWLRKQGDFIGSRKAAVKAFCSSSLMDDCGSKTKGLLAALVRETEWRLRGRTAG
jgi:hypothetical protein